MQGDDTDAMSSPWDVAWWADRIWIAMAGIHQLWTFDLRTGAMVVAAGTTNEGLRDGPRDSAWFAQTSGLSATGDTLWLADSETSALRRVRGDQVETLIGTGLFDFGLRDGPADKALLQHPLGVTALPDGSVAICDTYNDAIRRYDPSTGEVTTMATGLREPSGAVAVGKHLIVVESAAHRLTRVPLGAAAVAVDDFSHQTQRPATQIAPGPVELAVVFDPPPGQKLDDRYGPPTRLLVSTTPPALLRSGDGRTSELTRRLEIDPAVGDGVLHVAAMAASCEESSDHAACHVHQQDWGVPVQVVDGGATRLELVLSG
jgi:sugar lactone lactonase YvrE